MSVKKFVAPLIGGGAGRMGRLMVLVTAISALSLSPLNVEAQEYGVFMEVADVPGETVAQVSTRVEEAVAGLGWTVLAAYDAGVDPEACSYDARVIVVDWPDHTEAVLSQGNHGVYAAPFRVSVFEDELGVHVTAVNPRSLNRTMVAEEGMDAQWARLANTFKVRLTSAMGVAPAEGEFGQLRKKGRIGRTMGIMAGGPFVDKFKHLRTVEAGEGGAAGVAQAVFDAMAAGGPGKEWGIRPVYVMTPAPGIAVLGVTGERMEARSFSIVGRGSDKSRDEFACPGLDHSAAYPIEVVFTQEGSSVDVHVVDAMFRMKMFFEDAGKMKFARNMGMPGSIEDEIKELIRAALF